MELFKDRVNTVYLEGDPTWGVTATWRFNEGDPVPLTVAPFAHGKFSAVLPYLPVEGEVEVTWNLTITGSGTFPKVEYFQVVTPYLDRGEVKSIWQDADDQQADDMERAVRTVINSHTGQSFGSHVGTKAARGTGEVYLRLPARLLSYTELVGFYAPVSIVGDGWYLAPEGGGAYIPPVRSDYNGLNNSQIPGINHQYGVPIRVPAWMRQGAGFIERQEYYITGTWGWKFVPTDIKEAARLLVNDFASGDTIYRDRYLTSMTAADWRIQFNSGAFAKTGNVRADQLLSNYVLTRGWAVL